MLIFILFVIAINVGAFRFSTRVGSFVLFFTLLGTGIWVYNTSGMWYSRHLGARAHIQESFHYRQGGFWVSVRNDSDRTIHGLHVTCGTWSSTAPDIMPHTSYAGFLTYDEDLNHDNCWMAYDTVRAYGADLRSQDHTSRNNPL